MIYSRSRRFIFLKTRKTAGTSIEIALSQFCDSGDVITPISGDDEALRAGLGYQGPVNDAFPFSTYELRDWGRLALKGRRARARNHMLARDVRRLVGQEAWDEAFKFTVVRNPWDVVVSGYYFNGDQDAGLTAYLESDNYRKLVSSADVYMIDGEVCADLVVRYEQLGEGMTEVWERLGVSDPGPLPRAKAGTRSDRRAYREVLTEAQAEVIARDFAVEIAAHGYAF
ncbi:hypothetical protein [Demequina iriomotensis]|uniref:hypothetical protein n=1 Tax=Demequina iriomotensis TaxID=1536641 RepID=UPI000780868E|nr:hypothetical protein [Demequina iriomotensis]